MAILGHFWFMLTAAFENINQPQLPGAHLLQDPPHFCHYRAVIPLESVFFVFNDG